MLPVVLAITHTLTTYYIFSGLAVKGLMLLMLLLDLTLTTDKTDDRR